jgi:hypothetical protein
MGACAGGQFQSNYGCISQGACGSGYGTYNGQCVPINQGNMGGSCTAGQVMIGSVGCVPQGSCPANYGYYNNQCVAGTMGGYQQGGYNQGGYQYGAGACAAGQLYTYYGCMPTSGCPANQARYNNSCIPAMSVGGNGVPNTPNNGYGYGNGNGYGYGNGYGGYNSYPGNYGYSGYYNYGNSYPYSGGGYGNYGSPYGGYNYYYSVPQVNPYFGLYFGL